MTVARGGDSGSLLTRFVVVLVVAAVVSTGCAEYFRGLGDTEPDCKCPRLTELVGSIDWTGDGTEPDSVIASPADGPKPLHVSAHWRDAVDGGVYRRAVARIIDAGFRPVEADDRGAELSTIFETDTWRLHIGYSEGADSFYVVVWMARPDDRADEYLTPLIDIYGTRP